MPDSAATAERSCHRISVKRSSRTYGSPVAPDVTDGYDTPAGLHAVYVVELDVAVARKPKFAQRNPAYRAGQPCYYVDVTDLAVDQRFDQHMHGIRDNAFVRMHGIALRPDFTAEMAPSAFEVAVENEARIARSLRAEGCGVWAPVLDAPQASSVYVVRLDTAVLRHRGFRAANPAYADGAPCVYVGATGITPEQRFANHKAGHKANWYAQTYGETLIADLYTHLNPMTYQRALATEIALADELRREGWGVWQN